MFITLTNIRICIKATKDVTKANETEVMDTVSIVKCFINNN